MFHQINQISQNLFFQIITYLDPWIIVYMVKFRILGRHKFYSSLIRKFVSSLNSTTIRDKNTKKIAEKEFLIRLKIEMKFMKKKYLIQNLPKNNLTSIFWLSVRNPKSLVVRYNTCVTKSFFQSFYLLEWYKIQARIKRTRYILMSPTNVKEVRHMPLLLHSTVFFIHTTDIHKAGIVFHSFRDINSSWLYGIIFYWRNINKWYNELLREFVIKDWIYFWESERNNKRWYNRGRE